ncbi:isocitrate lyase/PEP mutase family protein [Polymorphobacter sp.]|uniref:isocitrate lyase/PEP mutase family protein n=1 Tax=Polymorphobacter sp. TaxID=1909290 RepID=UPI003F6F8065
MLRPLLESPGLLMVPGAWDGLSALLVEQAGFPALFLSGASLAYASLGRPDVGLATASELADACARIADRVSIPIIVDADSGYGSAVHLQRTVRNLERAGASAVQIEDQVTLKPLAALQSRPLVPVAEMLGRLRAAQDARHSDTLLISARTDAQPSVPFEETLDRCEAYIEAGCDLLLAEGLSSPAQAEALCHRFAARVPLIHNLLEGGASPYRHADELAPLGFRIALYAGATVQTMAHAAAAMLATLRATGSTMAMRDHMLQAPDMARLTGAPALVETAKTFQ